MLLALAVLLSAPASAQHIVRNYHNRSLSDVLIDLGKSTRRYKMSFIYNELEDFTVTGHISTRTVPEAVKAAVGFYPVRIEVDDSLIFVECTQKAASKVIGRVVDAQRQPVAYANVTLLSPADSTYINGGVTNENGDFVVPCRAGEAVMKITGIGYQTLVRHVRVGRVGAVRLAAEKYMLKGVTVKSQLPKTILRGEGMTTIVAGSILEKTADIEQMLDRIPTVSAKDGNIEVFGRGTPAIYINGRQRGMAELQQLNPQNVKSVEVIHNPGARYAASVTSVLRIVTKKPVGEGFSVDSRTQAQVNSKGHGTGVERVDLTYRTHKFELSAFLFGSLSHYDEKDKTMLMTTYTSAGTWRQNSFVTNEYHQTDLYAQLRANWQIDAANYIGATASIDRYPKNNCDYAMSSETTHDDKLNDRSLAQTAAHDRSSAVSVNAYYSGKLGPVDINFDNTFYWNRMTKDNNTDETFAEADAAEQHSMVNTYKLTYNSLAASKLVLAAPAFGGELSFGGEYSTSSRRSRYTVLPKNIIDDEVARIRENMMSTYADYSRQIGGNVWLQAGLRYEYVDFNYFDHGVRIGEQSRTFSNIFPSVAVSMALGKVQMQMGYATDISRPSYNNLRSGIQYDNRYTYEVGNPFLVPCIRRNINYAASWKWLMLSVMYSRVEDQICSLVQTYRDDPRMSLVRLENMPDYNMFNTSLSASPTFGIWSPQLELNIYKQWHKMTVVGGRKLRKPLASISFNNTVDMPWATVALLTTLQTKGDVSNSEVRRCNFVADLSVNRQMCNRHLMLSLYVSDLLHTGGNKVTYYSGTMRTTDFDFKALSSFRFTARYTFNVSRSKYRGKGAGQEQQKRM